MLLQKTLEITLAAASPVAAACQADDRPDEVHLLESSDVTDAHALVFQGLAASEAYTCTVAALDSAPPLPTTTAFTTPGLPGILPSGSANTRPDRTPAGAYTLYNHQRLCAGEDNIQLVMVDNDGRVRWFYQLPIEGSVDMGTEYIGDGLILWGGVSLSGVNEGAPTYVALDHEIVYHSTFPEAAERYHHISEMADDGSIWTLTDIDVYDGMRPFTGFGIHQIDPDADTLLWDWSIQTAIDRGQIDADGVVDWGGNWAGPMNDGVRDTVVFSLCEGYQIMAVDPASADIVWSIGGPDSLTLVDADGDEARPPSCQHGLDVDGQRLLVYDNAHFGGGTRMVEYTIDPAAGVATQEWEWTEGWTEFIWGDADYLDGTHVLMTRGHASCFSFGGGRSEIIEIDKATDEVVWRFTLDDADDGLYGSDRIDGCDIFAQAGTCPALDARLLELEPILGVTR
jgi:outer membrane protein assembly factor BamB